MTELDLARYLPHIIPERDADRITWKGPLEHLGPISAATPLQGALLNKSCCALYLLYIGCIGIITKRMAPIMNTNLNRCLAEQIFAYQFDWRYPSTYGITITDIEANPDKIAAIRRTIPYFFFQLIKGTNGYFHSPPSISEIGFVMNMTRHLGGKENKAVIENWMKAMIERLDHVAAIAAEDDGPVLQDFETRSEWEQAVLAIHGRPLPIELLDPESKVDPLQFDQLACAALARIDPTENPLLVPVADLVAMGFTAAPYRCAG